MLKYGQLSRTESGRFQFVGELTTPDFSTQIFLESNKIKTQNEHPDYLVFGRNQNNYYQLGYVWNNTSTKTGKKYFSITIDGYNMANELKVVAFPDPDNPDLYDIIWSRPDRKNSSGRGGGDLKTAENSQSVQENGAAVA